MREVIKSMRTLLKFLVFPGSVLLLLAAEPAWKTKQMEQWSEADAKAILSNSPWVKKVTPALLPQRGEDSRRMGGQMGGDDGVGLAALTPSTLVGGGASAAGKRGRRPATIPTFEIRWESARPVRAAEVKAREQDSPDVAGGTYAVAIYDVPGIDINQKTLPYELKREGLLKFEGKKKDRGASRVDLLPQEGGLTTIVYIFPRSQEITAEYGRITFMAQIGRLSVAQYFYTAEMQVQGKLEL
jgi:hypothetical protein